MKARELREIVARYGNACAYCGGPYETIDHATPLSRGGKHEPENILPACKACNFEKHSQTAEEFRAKLLI